MGQRHQLFVIARVQGRYRCIAVFHSQWLHGQMVINAAARVIRAFINPINAAAIASELSTISDFDLETISNEDDADSENPSILCPYLTGVFMSSFRVDMDQGEIYRLNLEPIYSLPSDFIDNDDGYTCFDVTEPGKPRHCFWWRRTGPLDTFRYLRSERDKRNIDPATIELLKHCSLIDVSTLAEVWPSDFRRHVEGGQPLEPEAAGPLIDSSPSPGPTTSGSGPTAATAFRYMLSSDRLVPAGAPLESFVSRANHLDALRTELLATDALNANGVLLLGVLLAAEKASLVDLKPWLSTGALNADMLLEISDALVHAEYLDLSGSTTLTTDLLESLVSRLHNLRHLVAFGCPRLSPFMTAQPLTSYLSSLYLLDAVDQTRFQDRGSVSPSQSVRWVSDNDPPAGLSVLLFTPPLTLAMEIRVLSEEEQEPVRYGVELAEFGAEGVVHGLSRFLQRLYESRRMTDGKGFYFEMRAYFHSTGAVTVSDCIPGSSDQTACYSFGSLPSLISNGPPGDDEGVYYEACRAGANIAVPRYPGWVLMLDTKGMTRLHARYTDSYAPEYAFERWAALPDQDAKVLRPVERLSVRDWVARLPIGHGRVPEPVLADCEAVLARLHVELRGPNAAQPRSRDSAGTRSHASSMRGGPVFDIGRISEL
ncbi:hypothetical protein AURDEDRAFT_130470 [Auricularia subglabra TFB-10046 SS5]|nr:hypothetical protein AURDEDRAFT_130470 [Auricularia subglabra TFB-10046 SS5]